MPTSSSDHRDPPRPRDDLGRLAVYGLVFAAGIAVVIAVQQLPRGTESPRTESAQPAPSSHTVLPAPITAAEPFPFPTAKPSATVAVEPAEQPVAIVEAEPGVITGVIEPAWGRFARLPLATSQPVAFIDVQPGDRIKKGWQVFSHWESPDRLQAVKNELERMKKLAEAAQARLTLAKQIAARLEKLPGAVTTQELQEARSNVAIRLAELEAAELATQEAGNRFTAMDFEFKQAFVTSPIAGIVASVEVVLGERRQFGETFRGVTVLDPRVLACRCLLSPEQTTDLVAESPAVVLSGGREFVAKVASVGVLAEGATGLIPVLLEVENPAETLRCGIRVQVRFAPPKGNP